MVSFFVVRARNQGVGQVTRGRDTMLGSDDCTGSGREFLGVDNQLGGRVHEPRSSSPDEQMMSVDSLNPDVVSNGGQTTTEGSSRSLDESHSDCDEGPGDMLGLEDGVPEDDIWDEWDAAALLQSERRKVQVLGKRRHRNMSITKKREDRGWSAAKALRTGLWSAAIGDETVCRKKEQIAKAVSTLTIRGMTNFDMFYLIELLSPDDYEAIRQSAFNSVAKFVLSIFDAEDFERVYKSRTICKKHDKLVSKLCNLKADTGPLAAIAEKKLTEEDFCGLREQDVGAALQNYHWFKDEPFGLTGAPFFFQTGLCQVDDTSEGDLKRALEQMEKFKPLKEEHKMQLTLELTHNRCYHVLDALLVEAWKGVEYSKLVQCLGPMDGVPVNAKAELLEDFVCALKTGIIYLATQKYYALVEFQKAVTYPLACGEFGTFGEEVFKVVQIADHKRRIQGYRYISLKHIVFGLSLSRVGEAVQKILNDRGLNKLTEKPPKMPVYFIYMLSREAANSLGENVVQLEHLALAIIYVKQENDTSLKNAAEKWADLARDHLARLKEANTRVESQKVDVIVKDLPEECYRGTRINIDDHHAVLKLIDAFSAGLSFPAIRA